MVVPQDGYLRGAQELLRKHKALLIADEVQTGLCRCAHGCGATARCPLCAALPSLGPTSLCRNTHRELVGRKSPTHLPL